MFTFDGKYIQFQIKKQTRVIGVFIHGVQQNRMVNCKLVEEPNSFTYG